MSTADLDLLAHHVAEPVDLFRIVKGSTRGAPAVLDSLRSNYERDAPPAGRRARIGADPSRPVDVRDSRRGGGTGHTMAGAWNAHCAPAPRARSWVSLRRD